jgi:hypothetical protein
MPIWASGFFYALMGLERPLRKHAGGMFLGRGRVPWSEDAPEWVWKQTKKIKRMPIWASGFYLLIVNFQRSFAVSAYDPILFPFPFSRFSRKLFTKGYTSINREENKK